MKVFLVLCLVLCLCVPLSGYDPVPDSFPRKGLEPEGVDPDRLVEFNRNPPTDEIKEYTWAVWKKEKTFFDTLETAVTPENRERFLGHWILQDEAGTNINKMHKWGAYEEFDILERPEYLRYTYKGSYSYVYYSKNGDFYISPNWDNGISKQLKLFNDRLYLYVLVYDEWILGPIHEGGKYFYVKHPPRKLFIP